MSVSLVRRMFKKRTAGLSVDYIIQGGNTFWVKYSHGGGLEVTRTNIITNRSYAIESPYCQIALDHCLIKSFTTVGNINNDAARFRVGFRSLLLAALYDIGAINFGGCFGGREEVRWFRKYGTESRYMTDVYFGTASSKRLRKNIGAPEVMSYDIEGGGM